ncbi:keratin, type II cytoskeletal 2 epidermal-like [Zootermopsis nevadensis]|uniref:Uncharacterized protein n=1 Tax=Zootermopsis nevadensis TaxID=136037 RepID=A0A067QUL9_ZOONE|nr:keratin, type II cytoskeletal 2 epidermal-like [Zootermopsis nevadensis]KDR13592.1 hypothetical protein L798_12281 [Zootermopsis nevadensis]
MSKTTDQMVTMEERLATLFLLLVWPTVILHLLSADDSIVFPDKGSSAQPKTSSNHGDETKDERVKPRIGLDTGGVSTAFNFGVEPNGGGISGSASFSSSYGGQGQAHSSSQSQSFNFEAGSSGFSASQAASQSSSFNSQFPGYHGSGGPSIIDSQASSQASSGSSGGPGAHASSHASSFGFQTNGANFGASSSAANAQGFSTALGRPTGGFGYYPGGGLSGSKNQGAGVSLENLYPDFIRNFQQGNNQTYKLHNGSRKRPAWFNKAFRFDKNSTVVFPE